jgi:hypothetical protein
MIWPSDLGQAILAKWRHEKNLPRKWGRIDPDADGDSNYFRAAAIFSFRESSPTAPTTSSEPTI